MHSTAVQKGGILRIKSNKSVVTSSKGCFLVHQFLYFFQISKKMERLRSRISSLQTFSKQADYLLGWHPLYIFADGEQKYVIACHNDQPCLPMNMWTSKCSRTRSRKRGISRCFYPGKSFVISSVPYLIFGPPLISNCSVPITLQFFSAFPVLFILSYPFSYFFPWGAPKYNVISYQPK